VADTLNQHRQSDRIGDTLAASQLATNISVVSITLDTERSGELGNHK
jgi:hypothetical protein